MANTNQFTINLGANLVTDDVPKQIQKLNAQLVNSTNTKIKIPIGVDPNGVKQFDTLIKQVNTYKDSYGNLYKQVLKFKELQQTLADGSKVGTGNFQLVSDPNDSLTKVTSKINNLTTEINKWTDSKGNINTWTTAVDDAGRRITTRVKESINDLGEITTETSKWGQKTVEVNGKIKSVYGQIGDATKTTKQLVQEMTTTTTSQVGQINDLGKSYQGLITTTEKVGTNGEYLKTVISEYTDATGRAVKVTEQFNKAGNKVATTMRKVGDIPKNNTTTSTFISPTGTKVVTEYANGIAVLRTVTREYTNTLGALIKETKVYDEQTHKLISTHKEELNNQKERLDKIAQEQQYRQQLTTVTRENEQTIQRAGATYKAIVKTIQEETHEYGVLTTTIITYKNALGETVVETQKVDENGRHIAQSTRTVTKELDNASNSAKRYAQSVKSVNNSSQTLGSALSRAFSRLTNYYVAMLPIRAFQKSITETIATVKNFDAAITEMGKVTDYSGEKLKKYTKDLAKLGKEVARTQTEMTEATTGWLKAGYSEEDAALLSKYSALLQNTADEELSAADATSILVSQLKAYHMEAGEAIKVTDIINKVSAEQAVSSYDISQGLTVASASMSTFGNTIEQTTALLTAGTTIFQGRSSQVARGLNMIATRVSKNEKALKDYGVSIYDASGELRSTYDILVDLAPAWDRMSKAEQVALGNTLAGTNQYKILAAIMSQMDVAQESYTLALESSGTTMKQNAVYMESLRAKSTALKAEFENLVLGNGGLQSFAKAILDVGTALLKFINSDIGKAIVTFGLLEVAILSVRKALLAWGQTSVVISAITSLIAGEATLTQVTKYLTAAIIKNTAAFMASPLFLGSGALAGIVYMGYAMKNYAEQLEKATENLKDLSDQAQSTKSELENTENQLEKIHEQIKKNNEQKLSITNHSEISTLEKETAELENQESSLKRQVELLELKLELENKAAEEAAKKTYETKGASNIDTPSTWDSLMTRISNPYGWKERVESEVTMVTPAEEMDLAIKKIEDLTAKKEELFKASIEELRTNGELSDTYKQQQKELADLDDQINDAQQAGQKAEDTLETILGSLKSNSKETVELRDNINSQLGSWLDANKEINKTVDAYNKLKELSKGGAVDLTIRPIVDDKEMVKAGWGELTDSGSYSTTYTSTFTDKALTKAINFTPILTDENGNFKGILSPTELQKYAEDVLDGVHGDELHLQIGAEVNADEFNGSIDKAIEEADRRAQEEHEWQEIFYEAEAAARGFISAEGEIIDSDEETEESIEELDKEFINLVQSLGITETELIKLKEKFGDSLLEKFLTDLQQARQVIDDTSTVIDNLQESLETASNALEEYNENGYLTLDTFQSLMGISAQYLAALVNEEGQLEINQNTLGNLVEQLKIAKIEELQNAAAMEIAANHTDDARIASANAEGAVSSIGNTIEATGNKALTAAGHVATFAASVAELSGVSQTDWTTKDKETINRYKELANEIAKVTVNTTKAGNAATTAGKKGAGAAKQAKDATKELNKELEDTKSKYDKVISWISKQYDKEIDNIKKAKDEAIKAEEAKIKAKEKEKDKALKAIEAQINALEKEKDARKKYWDEQIDALKKANDERKDALELQEKLDALERAKNTKVKIYKEGQGFVYDVDQTAVAEAQKALDEYLSEKAYEDELERLENLKEAEMQNYEDRIDALNEYKDKVQESYEKQIEALNEHKEQLEAQYDAEIELYENYKQQFEDMVNAYEEQQTKLLAQQLTGIDFENKNWMTRLDNLAKFVNEYNKLQKQLETGTTDARNTAQLSSGGGLPNGGKKSTASQYDDRGFKLNEGYTNDKGTVTNSNRWGTTLDVISKARKFASGVGSVSSDEIAIVGENPNQEIVIGSKINNGQLMSLGKGTGVVNANSSRTLASMLNQVGQFGASGFGSGNGTLNNSINNDSLTINGVTIQGANINDPQTFVNGLLNLKSEALQRAYKHR